MSSSAVNTREIALAPTSNIAFSADSAIFGVAGP